MSFRLWDTSRDWRVHSRYMIYISLFWDIWGFGHISYMDDFLDIMTYIWGLWDCWLISHIYMGFMFISLLWDIWGLYDLYDLYDILDIYDIIWHIYEILDLYHIYGVYITFMRYMGFISLFGPIWYNITFLTYMIYTEPSATKVELSHRQLVRTRFWSESPDHGSRVE